MIGIEETDEMDDKHIQRNPNETFPSYAKQQQQQHMHINTYKDSTSSNTENDNICLSEGIYASTTKENSFFEGTNTLHSHISRPNKFNEKQV